MATQRTVTVRLSNVLIDRLNILASDMSEDPKLSPRGEATFTDALRHAVIRGLEAIEADKVRARR